MDPREFIRAKRERGTHQRADLMAFVAAAARREIPDYQVAAWLMAAFLNGLDEEETLALAQAMIDSGRVFDWTDLGRPSADKHSTGGVGDKISLVLAPLVASCGVLVPTVAGRGLGHTGGTLDKLESIPGFRGQLAPEAMRAQLDRIGVAMVGQGPDLAPADGLLYALRDVTSTVESEPFIVSSIVSKKIAEGAGTIVYDVKCGNGAFMRTRDAAARLARRLVEVTRGLGRRSTALVTDMSQPLGRAAGNALEVAESIETLRGGGPPDVRDLTLELASLMLTKSGAEADPEAARRRAARALDQGEAWRTFVAMVRAQGGDVATIERPERLPRASVVRTLSAPRAGVLAGVDTFGLGETLVSIGAGRRSKETQIDPRVGIVMRARIGDPVQAGAPLADLHLAEDRPDAAARALGCFQLANEAVSPPRLVIEAID
jgi:pyrimidine-nucleoside phosphorylase